MQVFQLIRPVLLPKICAWEAHGDAGPALRFRQALALPIYTLALILDYTAAALGRLAAWIAGDDWPE
jgi:hypothetical protein